MFAMQDIKVRNPWIVRWMIRSPSSLSFLLYEPGWTNCFQGILWGYIKVVIIILWRSLVYEFIIGTTIKFFLFLRRKLVKKPRIMIFRKSPFDNSPPPPNLPPLRLQFLGFHPLLFTNSTWILESLTEFTCARVVTRGLRFIGLIHYVGSMWGRCRVDVG